MIQTFFEIRIDTVAAPSRVWAVLSEVERWPEWTASIRRVRRLSHGPLGVGARVRIDQPGLPPAIWRVTEWNPGRGFAWVSSVPGIRVTARHEVRRCQGGSQVTLSIHYEGLLGPVLAWLTRGVNDRYLAMEARGLVERCRVAEEAAIDDAVAGGGGPVLRHT